MTSAARASLQAADPPAEATRFGRRASTSSALSASTRSCCRRDWQADDISRLSSTVASPAAFKEGDDPIGQAQFLVIAPLGEVTQRCALRITQDLSDEVAVKQNRVAFASSKGWDDDVSADGEHLGVDLGTYQWMVSGEQEKAGGAHACDT